jgi:hypothetical protein
VPGADLEGPVEGAPLGDEDSGLVHGEGRKGFRWGHPDLYAKSRLDEGVEGGRFCGLGGRS